MAWREMTACLWVAAGEERAVAGIQGPGTRVAFVTRQDVRVMGGAGADLGTEGQVRRLLAAREAC